MSHRFTNIPDAGEVNLKRQPAMEVSHLLSRYPALILVAVTDGVSDNWGLLERFEPDDHTLDF